MTSIRPRLLLALFASMIFASTSSAQEEEEQKEVMGPAFTAIALGRLPYEKIYYRKGEELISIELFRNSRSDPYSLDRSSEYLELYTDHQDTEQDAENEYKLIGKAPLVQGTKKMLYFLRSQSVGKEGALAVALFGIDDSQEKFPKSSYRFINFVNAPLVIDFNRKRFLVKPGKPTVKKLNLSKAGAFTPFVVRSSKGKILSGTRLFSDAGSREMVLIFPPKKDSKRMDIRFFSD